MATRKPRGKHPEPTRNVARSSAGAREWNRVASTKLLHADPSRKPFIPETLARTVIAIPLLRKLEAEEEEARRARRRKAKAQKPQIYPVVIDLNLEFPEGRDEARTWVLNEIRRIVAKDGVQSVNEKKHPQYVFAKLLGKSIRGLVQKDAKENALPENGAVGALRGKRAIYHIWPDFKVRALIHRSISTVKADAAHAAFSAFGKGIVWAVLDSGVERKHPHFDQHDNLKLEPALAHEDFTGKNEAEKDPYGHGTHVAGIIAGELVCEEESEARENQEKQKKRASGRAARDSCLRVRPRRKRQPYLRTAAHQRHLGHGPAL